MCLFVLMLWDASICIMFMHFLSRSPLGPVKPGSLSQGFGRPGVSELPCVRFVGLSDLSDQDIVYIRRKPKSQRKGVKASNLVKGCPFSCSRRFEMSFLEAFHFCGASASDGSPGTGEQVPRPRCESRSEERPTWPLRSEKGKVIRYGLVLCEARTLDEPRNGEDVKGVSHRCVCLTKNLFQTLRQS